MPSSPESGSFRLDHASLKAWLLEMDPESLQALWDEADRVQA